MSDRQPLLVNSPCGLHCPDAGIYVDAWRGVDHNIVTHAHSDHARGGSRRYLCAADGVNVLRQRLGEGTAIDPLQYGEPLEINGVRISLHPAGHVLGSAQVRLERAGEVAVISGDYKLHADPTCQPFELIRCHTFISECTFGLPIFRWRDPQAVAEEINAWWRQSQELDRTCILLAYSLGKAQRVLALLDESIGPILLHGAVAAVVEAYRQTGVKLPPAEYATPELARQHRGKAMVIAPPSALDSPWARKFSPYSVAAASGWMQVRGFRRRRGVDRGFVLSDHVDWPGLHETINATGASRVIVTHGYTSSLARALRERGVGAEEFSTHFGGEEEEAERSGDEPSAETPPCEEETP